MNISLRTREENKKLANDNQQLRKRLETVTHQPDDRSEKGSNRQQSDPIYITSAASSPLSNLSTTEGLPEHEQQPKITDRVLSDISNVEKVHIYIYKGVTMALSILWIYNQFYSPRVPEIPL